MEGIMPHGIEWIILLLIVMLLFGPKNLPKIGRALGQSIRGFKEEMKGITGEEDDTATPKKVSSTPTDESKK